MCASPLFFCSASLLHKGSPGIGIQLIDPFPIIKATHHIDTLIAQFSWDPIWVGGDMEADKSSRPKPYSLLGRSHTVVSAVAIQSSWP